MQRLRGTYYGTDLSQLRFPRINPHILRQNAKRHRIVRKGLKPTADELAQAVAATTVKPKIIPAGHSVFKK